MAERIFATPLGDIRAIACSNGLRLLDFIDSATHDRLCTPHRTIAASDAGSTYIEQIEGELETYFCAPRRYHFQTSLHWIGTEFQQAVWSCLLHIGAGQTRTYGEVAAAIGRPSSARAVGAAVGKNPLLIVVPCHRVVGADHRVGEYRGGRDRKSYLLKAEGSELVS